MKLIITLEVVQAIVNYLTTKPYAEVFQLIEILSKLEPLKYTEGDK